MKANKEELPSLGVVAKPFLILVAEDDPDDRLLLKAAFAQSQVCEKGLASTHLPPDIRFVANGQELLDYLTRTGDFSDAQEFPMPSLVLVDLNMPIKDGREAIAEIKQNPLLRCLPLVVLTTSKEEDDVMRSYELGVSSFISKPTQFEGLVHTVKVLQEYWFAMCQLAPLCQSRYDQP